VWKGGNFGFKATRRCFFHQPGGPSHAGAAPLIEKRDEKYNKFVHLLEQWPLASLIRAMWRPGSGEGGQKRAKSACKPLKTAGQRGVRRPVTLSGSNKICNFTESRGGRPLPLSWRA
jgi:hypothetical protein